MTIAGDHPAELPLRKPGAARWLALPILLILVGVTAFQVPELWRQWRELQEEWRIADAQTVIGYVDIHPLPNFADKPENWVRQDGQETLLWSRWSPEKNEHQWFRFPGQTLDLDRLTGPIGRDVIRAIDRTVLEVQGGKHWELIPASTPVAPLKVGESSIAYPFRVLEKVEVINDTVENRPILVTYTPFVPLDQAVRVYNPMLEGRRITLGHSGYLLNLRPLLYDRGTESLWTPRDDALLAVAGKRQGTRLPLLSALPVMAWGDWTAAHPQGRLVVGADRSQGVPAE
jgi:hypothetical protein